MTALFRGPGSKAAQMGADNWFAVKGKLAKDPGYEIMHAAQLNEAEYAPLFVASLFFCAAKDIDVPVAASLAVAGQVLYFWPRWIFATPARHNNGFPFYVPGALLRYASLGMLTYAIFSAL